MPVIAEAGEEVVLEYIIQDTPPDSKQPACFVAEALVAKALVADELVADELVADELVAEALVPEPSPEEDIKQITDNTLTDAPAEDLFQTRVDEFTKQPVSEDVSCQGENKAAETGLEAKEDTQAEPEPKEPQEPQEPLELIHTIPAVEGPLLIELDQKPDIDVCTPFIEASLTESVFNVDDTKPAEESPEEVLTYKQLHLTDETCRVKDTACTLTAITESHEYALHDDIYASGTTAVEETLPEQEDQDIKESECPVAENDQWPKHIVDFEQTISPAIGTEKLPDQDVLDQMKEACAITASGVSPEEGMLHTTDTKEGAWPIITPDEAYTEQMSHQQETIENVCVIHADVALPLEEVLQQDAKEDNSHLSMMSSFSAEESPVEKDEQEKSDLTIFIVPTDVSLLKEAGDQEPKLEAEPKPEPEPATDVVESAAVDYSLLDHEDQDDNCIGTLPGPLPKEDVSESQDDNFTSTLSCIVAKEDVLEGQDDDCASTLPCPLVKEDAPEDQHTDCSPKVPPNTLLDGDKACTIVTQKEPSLGVEDEEPGAVNLVHKEPLLTSQAPLCSPEESPIAIEDETLNKWAVHENQANHSLYRDVAVQTYLDVHIFSSESPQSPIPSLHSTFEFTETSNPEPAKGPSLSVKEETNDAPQIDPGNIPTVNSHSRKPNQSFIPRSHHNHTPTVSPPLVKQVASRAALSPKNSLIRPTSRLGSRGGVMATQRKPTEPTIALNRPRNSVRSPLAKATARNHAPPSTMPKQPCIRLPVASKTKKTSPTIKAEINQPGVPTAPSRIPIRPAVSVAGRAQTSLRPQSRLPTRTSPPPC
ncbi:hypothetical protein CLU79DRAFT_517656 [Phycomyces nitens]|nr:hypothetical protein CLU79DRAFT_517656 [Phycomyces nitens]